FKDRGSLVEISKAKERGAKAVCVASTGNMAGSVAAYASIAAITCYVLVPEGTAIGKMAQALSYGARLLQVRGTYTDAARLTEEMSREYGFYLAGDYAFRVEGQKSQAFEIIEQLDWRPPGALIVPMGCGTNLAAIWKGFKEFYELGLIDSLPRLIGVQPEGCQPIVSAFNQGRDTVIPVAKPSTVASAVSAGDPLDGVKALAALRESAGCALALTDAEILEAQQRLARLESIFVEPAGAIPIAALNALLTTGRIRPDEVVVCLGTGNGLKDPKSALKVLPSPAAIEPTLQEVDKFLKLKLYEIRAAGAKNGDRHLLAEVPSKQAVGRGPGAAGVWRPAHVGVRPARAEPGGGLRQQGQGRDQGGPPVHPGDGPPRPLEPGGRSPEGGGLPGQDHPARKGGGEGLGHLRRGAAGRGGHGGRPGGRRHQRPQGPGAPAGPGLLPAR
ncbi:MAG: threonine synthase, partial [candidate division NC10 bacterium]|nr:threonine synthase [candidate division NC10 bacterium]